MFFILTLFAGCSKDENSVSVNTTIKEFYTVEARQEYADNLDTTKYQIIGERYTYHNKMRSTYDFQSWQSCGNGQAPKGCD